ncbi:MAG: TolC family protein [Rhodocyclales bacterium]|nr:TolC family protein [Rhodocyclales bacterium]
MLRPALTTLLLLACGLAGTSQAGDGPGVADPFDTEAGLRPVPCAQPRSADLLGLADVIDQALCNNPQTREVWAAARAQAGAVGVARAAWLPGLNATLGSSRVRTQIEDKATTNATVNSGSLAFSWLLYDFGAREATLESARQLLAAAVATQDSTTQAVFLAALQAFYQVHAQQAALEAAELSEKSARESLAAAEARYRAGSATPADRLQAQTALSQATLTRIRVDGELKNARGTLANAMGLDAHRPLRLATLAATEPPTGFERDVDALIGEARGRRPDLAAAEAQAQAARATVDATRAAHLPTVSLTAAPTWQDNSGLNTHTSSIGLTVNIPLFSGFGQTYRVRTAEAQAEQKNAQRDRLRLQVALDVWKSYQSLITATQSLRSTADLLAAAEQSERVALGRYRAGVGSILDLLSAQSALASARQQRVQSNYDWNVSRAALAQSVGALDAGILPVLTGENPRPAIGKP